MLMTVGIPAHNEEANIGILLKSLLLQKMGKFNIGKILVVSDGSTDQTVKEVMKFTDKKINLIINSERKGLNPVQNQIIKRCEDDLLVIINADVQLQGENFLENLVKPFSLNSKVGVVSAQIKCVKRKTLVGKILASSHELKESIAQNVNGGSNVYLCHGQARAFSKSFYKTLKWPYGFPEDSFSYFDCLEKGFEFVYNKKAIAFFAPSSNISDHIKQSKRFTNGKKMLSARFGFKKIKKAYRMPIPLSAFYLLIFMSSRPILTVGYLFIFILTYFIIKDRKIDHSRFEIATSSKQLSA